MVAPADAHRRPVALWSSVGGSRPIGRACAAQESPPHFHGPQKATHGAERGRMYDVLSALIPPAVVGGAFIFGVVKLLRSEAVGRRPAKRPDPESQKS